LSGHSVLDESLKADEVKKMRAFIYLPEKGSLYT